MPSQRIMIMRVYDMTRKQNCNFHNENVPITNYTFVAFPGTLRITRGKNLEKMEKWKLCPMKQQNAPFLYQFCA